MRACLEAGIRLKSGCEEEARRILTKGMDTCENATLQSPQAREEVSSVLGRILVELSPPHENVSLIFVRGYCM